MTSNTNHSMMNMHNIYNFIIVSMDLLSEEEKADLPTSFQGNMENEMMIKTLSEKLAKQDILGLKKVINHVIN